MTMNLISLEFIICSQGIYVDEEKVRAIQDWLHQRVLLSKKLSWFSQLLPAIHPQFQYLGSTYDRSFEEEGSDEAKRVFAVIKEKFTNTLILAFPNFEKVFELEFDACGVNIERCSRKKRGSLPSSVKS